MRPKKGNAAKTKAAITQAARRLFAGQDIPTVSYRDIAKAAGVSHGLLQQYFGTREQMIAAIIRSEIEEVGKLLSQNPAGQTDFTIENFRHALRSGALHFRDFARIITRAELAGVKPESVLDPATPTPAMALADSIRQLQGKSRQSGARLDPRLVSAYVNASLFAFATMSPWLMASVGLDPKDYEARLDEIAEISVKLVSLAAGMTKPENPRPLPSAFHIEIFPEESAVAKQWRDEAARKRTFECAKRGASDVHGALELARGIGSRASGRASEAAPAEAASMTGRGCRWGGACRAHRGRWKRGGASECASTEARSWFSDGWQRSSAAA